MADVEKQSGRSNSFRRMLELERAYMVWKLPLLSNFAPLWLLCIERLQASRPPRQSTSAAHKPEGASLQTRRAKTRSPETADALRRASSPIKRSSPLVVDTDSGPRHQRASAPVNLAEKMTPRVVTRPVSPKTKDVDEQSICVSPSWEAHGRRRKEKKMEKREKEEAAKTAQAKAKKTRLSKQPPPASSTDPLRRAEGAVPEPRGRRVDAGIKSPDKERAPRKSRSRSSSFASLIRSPLGFRRQSVDPPVEPEFVGGIKLELQRHLANDRVLDQQAKGDESATHPALRHDKANNSMTEPLRSPPPPNRPSGEPKGSVTRSYPPITRHEKHTRKRPLVSPTAPAVPDLSKIGRWRARVGLKPSTQPISPTSAAPETQSSEVEDAGEPERHQNHQPRTNETVAESQVNEEAVEKPAPGADRWTAEERSMEQAHHIAFAGISPAHDDFSEATDGQEYEYIRPNSRGNASTGYRTAPSTPPDPPRRSPRRSSLLHADDAVPVPPLPAEAAEPLRASSKAEASAPGQSARNMEARKSTMPPDGIAPQAADKLDASREAVRRSLSPMLRLAEAKALKSPTWTTRTKSLPVSSPDESCSDEFHSPSPPSTPATSRSVSDKGLPTPGHGAKGFSFDSTATKVSHDDARPAARISETVDGKGNHEFKDQVLASYHEATAPSPSIERRGDHEMGGLVAHRTFIPVPNHQSMVTKDKGASRFPRLSMVPGNQSWRAPQLRAISPRPEAANYLEEARRLPPAPSARGLKTRLGPPASFALPGDLPSPATTRSEGSRPSDASQHAQYTTTPGLTSRDRDPIAKMFVECCRCKFYHDMPSNLYEAMASPESALSGRDTMGYAGAISMTVKCPWCKHEMSTRCCAGLAAMVYVTERLH
ncbi:hypothetical protein HRG_009681 [Hirsutella rhossiliensis]|uniref:Uncharacterized protein n=1 Tax=Hirsutella rhossiliensis TaxID=111463 RepID=A0A9P8MQ70_9HYPO|nr:uncharacterized protein HRG_09681 [Hirsutella rhossiliensis]KAH0959220.1 hypothetical protein HRG_09681 [Hirsutella rhossiliensis]